MKIAQRAQCMEPFYVMEVAKAASELEQRLRQEQTAQAQRMIYLNIGEPDFTAPELVQEAAHRAIREGATQYTAALGLPALRERISQWYAQRFGVQVPARRIVVTAGASAALQLACLTLVDAGEEVLMPDPCYPCNRQFVNAANGQAVLIPTSAQHRFQLNADQVREHWGERTRAVLLASPSNPTGTSIDPLELRRIHEVVQSRAGVTLVDELYLGLSFDERYGQTALSMDDHVISINSFSKYFNMTGWRLGWLVIPESLVGVMERMAQHLFICPSTVAQHAALACFEAPSLAEYERRRAQFKARADFFIPALEQAGFQIPVPPDGAFYVWADCTQLCARLGVKDSWELAFYLMEKAHLAVTPGRDFSQVHAGRFIRFSTANAMSELQEAARRLCSLA